MYFIQKSTEKDWIAGALLKALLKVVLNTITLTLYNYVGCADKTNCTENTV